jgi:hypothetical protein
MSKRNCGKSEEILLKNPLGRKIPNLWGIKSPCLYRKNPSTGILERRFLSSEYDFLQCWKSRGVSAESGVRNYRIRGMRFARNSEEESLTSEAMILAANREYRPGS